MIACSPAAYEKTCLARGYTLEHCRKAVVGVSGVNLVIDEKSEFYPRKNAAAAPVMPTDPGPGSELKALLATVGIHASPTCKCNKMAVQMNEWGEASLDHIEEIVDVMEETAKKRGLPFLRAVGRKLVKMAVRRWQKKANSK
jgi:hypothetical protein